MYKEHHQPQFMARSIPGGALSDCQKPSAKHPRQSKEIGYTSCNESNWQWRALVSLRHPMTRIDQWQEVDPAIGLTKMLAENFQQYTHSWRSWSPKQGVNLAGSTLGEPAVVMLSAMAMDSSSVPWNSMTADSALLTKDKRDGTTQVVRQKRASSKTARSNTAGFCKTDSKVNR